MNILEIKPANYNPRKITDRQLEMLAKSMFEFGDLSGFVLNIKTGNLVGGHQRLKNIPQDAIIKKEKLENISRTGTVAEGYILANGERWSYREVEWDLYKEKMANIAANKHGGEFDNEKLVEILEELSSQPFVDFDLAGYEAEEIEQLFEYANNKKEIISEEVATGGDIVQDKEDNILIRISVNPGMWLGKREEMLKSLEKMEKVYGIKYAISE